jgi:hypothetical protein
MRLPRRRWLIRAEGGLFVAAALALAWARVDPRDSAGFLGWLSLALALVVWLRHRAFPEPDEGAPGSPA